MLQHLAGAAIALGLLGTAVATPTPPEPDGVLRWARMPNHDDIMAAYPRRALEHWVGGRSAMECLVKTDGTLTYCFVKEEAPRNWGFGAALVSLAPKFRADAESETDLSVGGRWVVIPLVWSARR